MTNTTTKKITAADAVRKLAEKHGGTITPEIVLADAKRKGSPLHAFFTWEDGKAAEKYRLHEASMLIRRIKVTYHHSDNQSIKVRAFVNVVEPDDDATEEELEDAAMNGRQRGIYVGFAEALKVDSYRDQIVRQCQRDVETFRGKYSAISEASRIIDAMDHFSATITFD